MTSANPEFRRVLTRNIALPLVLLGGLLAIFLAMLLYLFGVYERVARIDAAIQLSAETQKLVVDAETGLRGYLLSGGKAFLEPYENAHKNLPEHFRDLEAIIVELMGRADRPRAAAERYRLWDNIAQSTIRFSTQTKTTVEAMSHRKDEMDGIRAEFATLDANLENLRRQLNSEASYQAKLVAGLTVFACLLIGLVLALTGRRQLLSLSSSYEAALAAQTAQNAELTDLAWIRTGLSDLATRLRGELDEKALARNTLEFLATYLGGELGAVYVSSDGRQLALAGTYGFSAGAKAAVPAEFAFGEGLVGATADQRKLQVMGQLPADYFRVVSATGETQPKNLVLAPVSAEGRVNGVVELAFLSAVPPRAISLLDGAAEVIGLAVRSMFYRARLQASLEEAQQLAEELQAQQEELRVSNEELEERTKVLLEAQQRLESQHAELEQTNEQLEETATELEEQKRILDDKNRNLVDARLDVERKAEELATASRYKSEFLANMSHELRTPLNSSLILAKLLMDNPEGNLTREQIDFASTIHAAGNDLLSLINDILDLSKVEAGKIEVVPEDVSLGAVVESMMREFRVQTERKGLDLRSVIAPGSPATLRTDRQRLEQVLRNLLGNALKFTSRGYVELSVAATPGGGAVFRVKDTGIGIDPAHHAAIFEAFRQADGTTSRKYGGTGLGLSISSKLADLLGATITLESRLGEGATFSLTLPPEIPEGPVEAAPASAPRPAVSSVVPVVSRARAVPDDRDVAKNSEQRVVLIVEDDPAFARMILDLTHECGFLGIVAETVAEGEDLLQEWLPSAVVLDIKLPDGSGLALLDRLKNNPKTRHIPVHGFSVSDYSREALQHGAVGFATKPTQRQELKGFLTSLFEKVDSRVKRVLLVEDDPIQVKSIVRLIGEKGVELFPVSTGQAALEALGKQSFDCMITDLKLPDMSGVDILERATRNREAPIPPVIVYTAKEIERSEEEALLRHSRSIIIKGARSPERLLEEVTLLLHRPEAELSPEQRLLLRSSRNREKAFEGRTILVVDDDVRNVFALTNALEHKGARALIARNGREALESVEKEPAIDLVLMDVMMPEMDGLEAIRRIRAGKRKDLAIIAVTAKAMADDYERCLQAGANDYLAKPVNVDRLVSLIRVWLPKRMGGL